jgi:sterol desaturase/sphingolipid hydroxylase (fatty acid hydroxylase superfamily)
MDLLEHVKTTFLHLAVCAAIFGVLTRFWPCNQNIRWWNLRSLSTDLVYWLVVPILLRYGRLAILAGGVVLLFGWAELDAFEKYATTGFGPIAALPFYVQVGLALVLTDIGCYWLHRVFHGPKLWRFHAIHHSSEHLDWISSARFHPVNILLGSALVEACLVFAGFSPLAIAFLAPFNVVMNAFVHANLNWTLGPFKYVIATPVFHRWHHTSSDAGGEKNFAPTFPVIDLAFGTFHMPEGKLPESYGVDDRDVPEDFVDHMLYPFRRPKPAPAATDVARDEAAWRTAAHEDRPPNKDAA